MPFLKNSEIVGEPLTWGHPSEVTYVQDVKLIECEITLTCPGRGIIINDVEFHQCSVQAKRVFSNHQFFHASFFNCRFVGKFPGCEFGYRELFKSKSIKGEVIDCNFKAAELDMAAFNGVDMQRIELPRWPYFAILSPKAFTEIHEMADDPEWSLEAKLPWDSERTALVQLYRNTGRYAFNTPIEKARDIFRSYPNLISMT